MGKVIDIMPLLQTKRDEEHSQEIVANLEFFKNALEPEAFYNYTVSYIVSTGLNMLKDINEECKHTLLYDMQVAVGELSKLIE